MNHYFKCLQEEIISTILDSITDGVLIANLDNIVVYMNKAYCKIVNIPYDVMINKSVIETRPGTRLPEVLKTKKPLLGIRRSVNNVEYITDISPIIVNDELIGAISIVRDITSVMQLSSQLNDYYNQIRLLKKVIKNTYPAKYNLDDIKGCSKSINEIKRLCRIFANNDMPILITGESGVGKELFAHSIHNLSKRSNGPFVAINCAAIPETLLQSELFGYVEGAFTGASKGGKVGVFEICHNGTLFLDEIGDMDIRLQSKLLRVVETGEFIKIGGDNTIHVDVRIISATNRNLEQLIVEKKFRQDLYYRLNTMTLHIPPLRERKDDIIVIAEYILDMLSSQSGIKYSFSVEAIKKLNNYSFPGNVRELINIIKYATIVSESHNFIISADDIILHNEANQQNSRSINYVKNNNKEQFYIKSKDLAMKKTIIETLDMFGYNVAGKKAAAKYLGISLATLYNRIREYNI